MRDDIARALQLHDIAFADILARDFILVMKCRAAHHHAADGHGLEIGDRRQRAGAADLNEDAFEFCGRLFRREFMSDGPARRAADEAEPFLPVDAVELVNDTVDIEGQAVALLFDLAVIGEELRRGFADPRRLIERKAPMFDLLADVLPAT